MESEKINDYLLDQVDAALKRMEERGHTNTPHYLRLQTKREAVATGVHFAWVDVSQEAIAAVGGMVPAINKDLKGKHIIKQ